MRNHGALLVLLAAVFGLASCSSQKSARVGQRPAAGLAKRQAQVSSLRGKVVSLLEKKNYRQALELMNGRNYAGLESDYVLAINGLLEAGETAFSLGDYAAAAHSFKGALDAYPPEHSLREHVSHSSKQIRSSMETCADRMMEQGLEEYRRGRLESAVSKWKEVLRFSPGHQEARKSIDTTAIQLQALQNLKNK